MRFFKGYASYTAIKGKVKDDRLDVRQFVTPLTKMTTIKDLIALNTESKNIIKETRLKPMVSLFYFHFHLHLQNLGKNPLNKKNTER